MHIKDIDGKAIVDAANKFIRTLKPRDFRGEAINWGDLYCTGVHMEVDLIDKENAPQICVEVEEASPDCERLPARLADHLHSLGYENIRVETEW